VAYRSFEKIEIATSLSIGLIAARLRVAHRMIVREITCTLSSRTIARIKATGLISIFVDNAPIIERDVSPRESSQHCSKSKVALVAEPKEIREIRDGSP